MEIRSEFNTFPFILLKVWACSEVAESDLREEQKIKASVKNIGPMK